MNAVPGAQGTLQETVSCHAFERRYAACEDPWRYRSSAYETAKYEITLHALRKARYHSAFEPGCSIGELTWRLADRCERLLSIDFSPTAVGRARARCRHLAHVAVTCGDLATHPVPSAELIVLSEMGYYFDESALAVLAHRLSRALCADGELIAVHWLGDSPDHILHGDRVHDLLHAHLAMGLVRSERHPGFRLDSWVKP